MIKNNIKTVFINRVLKRQTPVSLNQHKEAAVIHSVTLELDKVYCVINFDDLSPIPDDSKFIGRGGNLHDFVSVKQLELLKLYPFLGITHFMVPWFIPSDYIYYFDRGRYSILNKKNAAWLDYNKELSSRYNIEFACHGLYHRQFENLFFARHTEFAYLNYTESLNRLQESIRVFNEAGITPKGFRPPGWDINSDLSILDSIKTAGLQYAALSSYDAGLNSVRQRVSYYHPALIKGIINFPDNVNLDQTLDNIKKIIRQIVDENGIISIKGHFCSHTLTNSFSEENFLKLKEIIKFIQQEYPGKVEFATFSDVYERLSALSLNDEHQLSLKE